MHFKKCLDQRLGYRELQFSKKLEKHDRYRNAANSDQHEPFSFYKRVYRTHRSIIVDATKIQRLNLETHELILKKKTLPIGATYKDLLISRLRKIG